MKRKPVRSLIGELRQAVVDSGKSLGELARDTGVDKSALSRFVNVERGLSMEADRRDWEKPRPTDCG